MNTSYIYGEYGTYTYRARELTMPRIHDFILDCVIYLYPDEESAKNNKDAGGSGFMLMEQLPDKSGAYIYAVTNSHIIRESMGNSPVVRINTRGGGFEVVKLAQSDWVHHPNADDLAICDFPIDRTKHLMESYLTTDLFAMPDEIEKLDIGIGDDVFFTGRLMLTAGNDKNLPVLRFGNIARMPIEPIADSRGIKQECFLVEARSVSGFSGSPVFVYLPSMTPRPKNTVLSSISYTRLLGVDCGHINWYNEVGKIESSEFKKDKELKALSNSGIMRVVPAWKLRELLDLPELKLKREQEWEIAMRKKAHDKDEPKGQVVEDSLASDDFEQTLRKVTRKAKPSEPDQPKSKT